MVLIHAGTNNSPSGRNLDDASSKHSGGSNVLYADGSVHFVRSVSSGTGDAATLQAMGTIAGGEVVTSIDFASSSCRSMRQSNTKTGGGRPMPALSDLFTYPRRSA